MEPHISYELVYHYASTTDQAEADRVLTEIIAFFVDIMLTEVEEFSAANDVDMADYDTEQWVVDYTAYLLEILLGLRQRTQEEKNRIAFENEGDFIADLREWFIAQFDRILYSELVDAKQLGEIIVAHALQQQAKETGLRYNINKTWKAFPDCCPICRQLEGTTIPVDQPFLVNGQQVDLGNGKTFIYDYVDRYIAFAHPNDRCWIELSIEFY